eukprot:jgi/Bigna1/134534/aug1.25_g9242
MRRPRFETPSITTPAVEQKSYRVDKHGATFQHGALTITEEGVKHGVGEEVNSKIKFEDVKMMEKLGTGTSGVVHRAIYERKDIAIKVIDIYERQKRHQLLKEIRGMSKAISPFIASFFGAFFHDGSIYIALEFLDAGSLEDILKVTTFPIPAIRLVARQLVAGLDAIHTLKQMHRDIKPSNICLSTKGEAKLTDFGISREMSKTLDKAKTFIGTVTYMSPERIQGGEYNLNSDIWSLGLTLLQSVIGRYPYSLTGVYLELMQQIVQNPAPSFPINDRDREGSKAKLQLRSQFRDIIALCLQKDPKKRISSKDLLNHNFLAIPDEKLDQDKKHLASWILKVKKKERQEKHDPNASNMNRATSIDASVAPVNLMCLVEQ